MCWIESFETILKEKCEDLTLLRSEPLAKHTSFRTGGPAALLAQPKTADQLRRLLSCCAASGVTPKILGAGTNVLAPDAGVDGLVILIRDGLIGLRALGGERIEAYAGESLARAALFARDNGLTGMEFAHGIPGSVGGGVYMNAGAYGSELGGILESVTVMDPDGTLRMIARDDAELGYRTSIFQREPCVIVKAVFQLRAGDREEIDQTMRVLMARRRASQPLELPSAGSTFKRPEGHFAGALIEQAGLKGRGVGGAQVSPKHAGFIVNTGGATSADVLATIEMVQEEVWQASHVRLEPEVRIW